MPLEVSKVPKTSLRAIINEKRAKELFLYRQMRERSEEYIQALELNSKDLAILERAKGPQNKTQSPAEAITNSPLQFSLDGKLFTLILRHVCGIVYADDWAHCLMVVCASDEKLNQVIGSGTLFFSLLPAEWHRKVVACLSEDEEVIDDNDAIFISVQENWPQELRDRVNAT